ncbi:quinone oxidoreductase family protein [Yinghuangia seranimata]|uniref:quinone oxidoreductase family protein n=1 Tax=Yinghuangia seranimata TaxID=408067 RepID=UPI00248CADD0|nr:quinone oxidoreductase [Yinghuangia seranimata]MDI2128513.1 quinone oxidoreductase [Yinghuangia seranimata]
MARAVRFHETGGPEVLRLEEVAVAEPGPGEALVRHAAVGLNFVDVYFRSGLYPAPLPSGLGVEGAGVVEATGEGVTEVSVGDRVVYVGGALGAYSTERVVPAAALIRLPDGVDFDTAAAGTLRGLTAAYLLRRIHPLKAGDTVLLHAAAGGVGLIFSQWAKLLGIDVIGTVSTEEKAELALAHGCRDVILYRREDVAARVRELTDGVGVPVVYDSIGKDTFESSLASLKRRGLLVVFGTASGAPSVDVSQLARAGSVFLTRPGLEDYLADPADREELVGEFFGHVETGRIKVVVNQRYGLGEAARAHSELESARTTGSSVFLL